MHTKTRLHAGILAALLMFAGFSAGCGLLESDNPGSILATDIEDPATIPFLVAGQKNELALQLDGIVIYSGMLADELIHAGSFPTWREMSDGDIQDDNTTLNTLWAGLQRSRFLGEDNVPRFKELLGSDAAADVNVATALNIAGFAYVIFADNYQRLAYDTGPEVSPAGSYQLAVERFTEAAGIASAGNHDEQLQLANAGLARANLMLGNLAAALEAAQKVDLGFSYLITYDPTNSNRVHFYNHLRAEYSVAAPFRATGDSRVVVQDANSPGGDNVTPMFIQFKYDQDVSPIRLASGAEAALIAAEALNEGGDAAQAVVWLNQVRAQAGLADYDGDGSVESVRAAIRVERAYELFLEGKRLADLRRYAAAGDAESGAFFQGRRSQAFPLPDSEYRTNPNVSATGN